MFERPRNLKMLVAYPAIAGAALTWIPGPAAFVVAVVAAAPFAFLLRTWSAAITPEGIAVRTVRRRFIAWDQIRSVEVCTVAGDRSIDVFLLDGSRQRLPAPLERHMSFYDAGFDAKYASIVEARKQAQLMATEVAHHTPNSQNH